eukprot:g36134.t1
MDVQSLYMSIPYQDGPRALCFFLEQRPEPPPPTTTLLYLDELAYIFNNFSFNSCHFLQVRGVAMDACMGPRYACLFMGYLDYTSSHPASCEDSILFSQFICLCRMSSDEANFDKGASEVSTFFLNRGFPSTVVDRALSRANWVIKKTFGTLAFIGLGKLVESGLKIADVDSVTAPDSVRS